MRKIISIPFELWFLFGLGLSFYLSVTPVEATDYPSQIHWISGGQVVKMGDELAQAIQ